MESLALTLALRAVSVALASVTVLGLGLMAKNQVLGKLVDIIFKCSVVTFAVNICCKVCKFEFGNVHIRPPVVALLLDVVLGLESVVLAMALRIVVLALRIESLLTVTGEYTVRHGRA